MNPDKPVISANINTSSLVCAVNYSLELLSAIFMPGLNLKIALLALSESIVSANQVERSWRTLRGGVQGTK